MKNRWSIALGVVGVLVAGCATPPAAPAVLVCVPQEKQLPAPKIAVVSLKRCFDREAYARVKAIDARLEFLKQEQTTEETALSKELETLLNACSGIPDKSTKLYLKKYTEYKVVELRLDMAKRVNQARFLDEYNDLKADVYNEIRRAVSLVAKDEGWDLVLRVDGPQLEETGNDASLTLAQRIAARSVLYAVESMDISGKVIDRLNEEYKKKAVKICSACKRENPARAAKCPCGAEFPD